MFNRLPRDMSLTVILAAACLALCVDAHHHHQHHHHHHHRQQSGNENPLTQSVSGVFRGSWMETRRGRRFESYRGIRYAEPPVGELRFQPPKLILQYSTEVNATTEGPACPLPTYYITDDYDYTLDEDCLRLNVYTPLKDGSRLLPVIVYIHAGGFYSMSGRSDLAGPHYFLDRDVVLVTINYRLASLGFMSTGDEHAPGNNGLKDQVMALRWVQRNIEAFGGDPNLVTISGCSAGSISVMLHMISPMSKGLFHRAISTSGGPSSKEPSPHHQRHLAVKQAQFVGCPTNSSKAIIDCLKTKTWEEIGNTLEKFYVFAYDPISIWWPVVELDFGQERFLPIDPMEAVREGKMHPVPYIISQTHDELFWMAFTVLKNDTWRANMSDNWEKIAPISFTLPQKDSAADSQRLREVYLDGKPLVNDEKTSQQLGKLYSDSNLGFPIHRFANLMCRHSSHPVWYYEFSYIGNHSYYEDPTTEKPIGAAHQDDLIYLFTLSYRFPTIPADGRLDSVLVDRMTAIFYTFAVHGDPNHSGLPELSSLSWPAMTPDSRRYLRIGDDFQVDEKLKEDQLQVWEELYPFTY